jgi:glycosyltransferase involved in cell wall biosynthesis
VSDVVVMPVYNESATVSPVLDAVRARFDGEIIVIDDGSDDGTQLVLAERDDIAVVRLERNCGYGCALRIGFDVATELGHQRLITMDCDGQHEPAHIPQFLEALDCGCDIISGSRYLPESGAIGDAPSDRREINAKITAMVNEQTGWSLTDSFCGFKAYRMEALRDLTLTEAGYAMPLELWAQAWQRGLTVRELAVERIYCDRDRSFGESLDDPDARYAYYLEVWRRSLGGD